MPFCSGCGKQITDEVNFCPHCGHKVKEPSKPEAPKPPEKITPVYEIKRPVSQPDPTYSILEQGHIFKEHYRIEKNIGKDNDGVTYMVTDVRNDARRSLKIYHPSYFANVDKMLGAIVNMSKVRTISHPNIAKVYETRQTGKPAFIVSEYIDGRSLAIIKEQTPEQLNEEKSREIAKQLVDAAITIRKAGLAIRWLNINNIVVTDDGKAVILAPGINYDVSEERDDIFNMGLVLAKLFSTSAFFETLYTPQKIGEKRFDYISGITVEVNDLIAACLQKNKLLKYTRFEELEKALKELKPYNRVDVYEAYEASGNSYKDEHSLSFPERRLDVYFWLVIIFIAAFIFVLLTTNLLDKVFGQDKTTFKYKGFVAEAVDSVETITSETGESYRNIKTDMPKIEPKPQEFVSKEQPKQKVNPAIVIPPPKPIPKESFDNQNTQTSQNQTQTTPNAAPPQDLVRIGSDVFAYGTLRQDAKANASLSVFYISPTEVTQAEWNKHMTPVNCSTVGDNLPVDNVSWFDAITYCNARSEAEGLAPCYKVFGTGVSRSVTCNFKANGYRLPTEAEWEYTARGKQFSSYSGSDTPETVAWFKDNSGGRLHQVKTKADNALNLYDMTGNVSEWCWDWYDTNYPKNMPYLNPSGPDLGNQRAIRGGNVSTEEGSELEVTERSKDSPASAFNFVGFRVVRTK